MDMTHHSKEVATLGGGCFWCLEAVYDELDGVLSVESGYSGGAVAHPTYRQVCTGMTGHAEVVQITFDPAVISFREILQVFFDIHDPTTPNRQGADVGTQYRSAIFYGSEEEKQVAASYITQLDASGAFDGKIVTVVEPLEAFYAAEAYHQDYVKRNPTQAYVRFNSLPKVQKVRTLFG